MGFRDWKERAVNFVLNRVQDVANKQVNIEELQERHNAKQERVGALHLTDVDKTYHFRIKDGELEYLTKPDTVDGGVETDTDTIIALAKGERTIMDPATGEERQEEYTPIDAVRLGDLHLWGEAVTNDILLFGRALHESVYPRIQSDLQDGVQEVQPQESA